MSKASDFLLGKVSSSDENDEVIQPNTTDITGDSAWKYIDAGDISGFADWTNRNMNYRDIPFLGQIVGHTADAATQGIADAAQFVGADGVSNYLNEKAQEGENYLPPMATPELSLDYVTDPNGLASATGMLVGSMLSMAPATMLVPESAALKVGSLLKGLPKIGTVASEFAPKAVKWAATGPVEAAMEGGNTERQMLQNGATPEEAKRAAWNDFYGNVGLLTATNALEGGLLGKVARVKTPTFQNGLLNTASKIAGYAPATAAEAALQGYEEGAQQGIQEGAMDGQMDMNHILNPNAWDDEQWENAKFAVAGGLPLVGGSALIRRVGGRGNNATDSAEDLIAQAEASTQAKLAHDSAQAQTAEQATAQPAFAVAEPEETQAQESASTDFDAGTYDMPTQGDAITAQVQNLKSGWQSVLPQIGGVLHNQFGLDGVISSAARTPEHNAEVGGAEHSHHIDNGDGGDAVDIVLPDGTTAEQAEQVKQYFENSGAFQEVLFHDAGSGYHLHLGGLKGSLGDAGASAGGGLTLSSGDEQIDAWIQEAADANGVPANLLSALLDVESGYNVDTPNSEAGAIGIAQFMPGTAEAMGIDPRDPHQAISGAARLLKQEYDHYGNWSQALEAYNGGEGNVGSGETQAYAQKVLGKAGDISHVGGGNRASSGTNFLNEKSSFDINSDDAEGRKMISDFIDYWGNRANVDDADTIQGMLDANGKFRNTQENRDTVREKWGDELQQYADEHMKDEQEQDRQETQAQKQAQQQADAARRAAQGGKKAASVDNTKAAIDTSTPNLDAAKQQQVSTTPQATSIDTAGESEQTQAEPAQSLPNTAHLQPNTEHPASETAHPATAAQAKAQQAQPTTQASQPTAQAAPIEQAKAPNVPKNEPQNAQQNSQAPAQPQTPTMDAQQATKQQNALSQPAQTPQQANPQMSPAQQRARAAKEQRLQKELETNATLDQIERGQQLEAAAKQASVALPKGMAGALHRGQPQAIAQATSLLKGKGVALPTVEASGNTVYGAAETTGRENSAQPPRKQLTTKASYTDKSQEHGRGSLNCDKITAWDGSKGGIPKKDLNFSVTLDEIEKALASYGNGRAGLRKLVKQRYDAAVERWIESAKNPEVRAKRRHYWEDDTIHTKGGAAYDRAVDSYARVVEHLYEAATGQKAESPFERRMRERNEAKSQAKEAVANGGRGNSAQNATAPRKVEPAENASGQQMEKPSSKKSTPSRKPVKGKAGKSVTVTTDSGKELHARYRIVPASSLTTSNVYDGDTIAKNDAYPQELQPRERSGRKEMQAQTDGMAADLHPADLEASRNLNQGAPLIRSDGVVLNGNGRTMAITRAYVLRNKAGKRYTQYLIEHAEDFGFTKDQMRAAVKAKGTGKPVLVRELTDDADEATTQDIINSKTGGARMSATEQAETDAKSITSRDFDGYDAESDGDLTKAGNDGFVAKLLRKLVGKDEINAYTDANGSVNQDGYRRVKRAIFSRAYGDTDLIAKMAESMDDAIKNISNGLQSAAANVARLNLKMQEGDAYDYPLAKTIARAVKKYNAIKEGKAEANVEAYANENETSLTGGDPEEVVKMVQALDDFHRSGKKVGVFLNHLADILDHQGSPKEDATALDFGEAAKPLTFSEAIDQAKEKTETGGEQDLFGAPKYSIEKAKERHERTLADLKREIASAFPGAKNVREDGDRIAFDMPNGSHLEIWMTDNIELSSEEEAQAKRDHGVTGDMHIKVNGYEVTVGKDAIIALSKAGEKGTAYHEVLHIAMDILFSDREKAALAKKFGKGRGTVEEHIAEAFRCYKLAREHGAHVPFGKLFQRIQDFFANLADHYKELRGTMTDADVARRAFRELANGKAWERDAGEGRGARKFAGEANADENPVDNGNEQADNEGERKLRESLIEKVTDASFIRHISDRMTVEQIREQLLTQDLQHKDSLVRRFEDIERKAKIFHMTEEDAKKLTDSVRKVLKDALRIINAKRRLFNEPEVRGQLEQALRSADKIGSGSRLEKSLSDRRGGAPRLDAGRPDERLAAELVPGEHKRVSHPIEEEIQKELTEENHGQHYSISRSDSQDGFSRAKNPRKFAGEANADENPVDNRNGQNDNEGEERARFIDRLLNEKVPENGRTSIDSDVKDGIARFGKEITPENVEDVFDSLHCVRMLRATFNDNGRMQNYANGLDYAQKMAAYMYGYARRCFENDERIKRQLALRGTSVGRPAEVRDAHAEGRPGRAGEGTPRNGGQALQGTSLAKHGNVKALQELYDKLVDEAYHGKQYSVSRSDHQDGFSRAQNPRKYSIAYHGTQHEFDKFDVGKIGRGEGTRVHGWGIYFAKNREVSQKYRDTLAGEPRGVTINGTTYHYEGSKLVTADGKRVESVPIKLAVDTLVEAGSRKAALERADGAAKLILDDEGKKNWAAVRDLLKDAETHFEQDGMLAEVSVPEDDVMLDEQKPFAQQPKEVQSAIRSMLNDLEDVYGHANLEDLTEDEKAQAKLWRFANDFDRASGRDKVISSRVKDKKDFLLRNGARNIDGDKHANDAYEFLQFFMDFADKGTEGRNIYDSLCSIFGGDKNASIALNEYGVKGIKYKGERDGDCYVVFDDKAVSIIRKLSASRAKEAHVRAIEDIKAEVMKAFPGAKDVRDTGDRITFTMPNGAKVAIRIHDNMTVTDEEAARARRAHGIADGVTITVNGSEYTIGRQAVIDLSQRGEVGTVYHEALHVAMDLLFDDKTKAALMKKYGSEEKIADAYRKFMLAEARGGHVPFGKPLRAIRDFFRALAAHIAPIRKACGDAWTAQKAFEDLASGKAWEPASKKSHGFSIFSHAEAAERPIDNEAARGDNEGEKSEVRKLISDERLLNHVKDTQTVEQIREMCFARDKRDILRMTRKVERLIAAKDPRAPIFRKVLKRIVAIVNQHRRDFYERDNIERLEEGLRRHNKGREGSRLAESLSEVRRHLDERRLEGLDDRSQSAIIPGEAKSRHPILHEIQQELTQEEGMEDARKTGIEPAHRIRTRQDAAGLHSWRDIEASSRKHGGDAAFTEHPAEVTKTNGQHHSVSRSERQDGFSDAEKQGSVHYSITPEEKKAEAHTRSWFKSLGERFSKAYHLKSDKVINDLEKSEAEKTEAEKQKEQEQLRATDRIHSPHVVASRLKTFRVFYVMGDRAMNKLVSLRNQYSRKLTDAYDLVKDKDDKDALFDLLLRGDTEGKEWKKQELLDEGVKENVADAYIKIRRLMTKAYHMVNNARRHPVPKTENVTQEQLDFIRQSKFTKNIDDVVDLGISSKDHMHHYRVSYTQYRHYERTHENITGDMLAQYRKDPGIDVLKVKEVAADADGRPLYNVKVQEGPADMNRLTGYIPHFFHDYFLRVLDENGKVVATIGSGRTQRDAIIKGEEWLKGHKLAKGQTLHVQPKVFDFGSVGMDEHQYAAVMGDMDFYRMTNALAKENDMTLEEARAMLDGKVRLKGRHRFFGNALHRRGVEGYETDLNWVLTHYFNSASRYAAMETEFKPKAISAFERFFGRFDDDYADNDMARICKRYINNINGNPSTAEEFISKLLNSTTLFKKYIIPTFGDRSALTLGNGITNKVSYLTLGLNMSSALLNFSQLVNSAAYIGEIGSLVKMVKEGTKRGPSLAKLRDMQKRATSAAEKERIEQQIQERLRRVKILQETGVYNDIGLDSGSGYDQARMGAAAQGRNRFTKALYGINVHMDSLGNKSMFFFQHADAICRRGTVLAAYEKARREGKTHAQAIAYAKEINVKANFIYGVQDTPDLFQRGSIISQLALQFKKFGLKELEVMADFMPDFPGLRKLGSYDNIHLHKYSAKQKAMFWGMFFLMSGLMGVPALDWLDDLFANLLPKAFGTDPHSTKDFFTKLIVENIHNKALAKAMLYGASGVFNINLSSRAGLSDVIPSSMGDFAGPTLSKGARLVKDYNENNWPSMLRDVSPGMYNLYAAYAGESRGKRDRLNDRYVTAWDRILRAVGFRSVDETIPTDMQRIISRDKAAATKERQEAQDAYIQNPTSENKQRLKDLGIKEKDVQKEATKKNQTREERTQGTVPKKDKDKYKPLTDFMKE